MAVKLAVCRKESRDYNQGLVEDGSQRSVAGVGGVSRGRGGWSQRQGGWSQWGVGDRLTFALQALAKEALQQPLAVLADGWPGVGVH